MVEVLTILGIATKEVKGGGLSELMSDGFTILDLTDTHTRCLEKYLKKVIGNTDIEDSLARLDKLTQEEARMASAELLKMTHSVDGKVIGVDDRVKNVQGKIQDICDNVQDVRGDVKDVRGDVQDARGDVQDVGNMVQDVDDKLEQANRLLSP